MLLKIVLPPKIISRKSNANSETSQTQNSAPINITSCATLIPELCSNQWQRPGQWVWLTANNCSIGSFLPPTTFVGAAPWPSAVQCEELIYASMVDECAYSGVPYNIAAVNLRTLPADEGGNKGTYYPLQSSINHSTNCAFMQEPRSTSAMDPISFRPGSSALSVMTQIASISLLITIARVMVATLRAIISRSSRSRHRVMPWVH